MKKLLVFRNIFWIVLFLLGLAKSSNALASDLHLKVTETDGSTKLISVSDGMEMNFSDKELTIKDNTDYFSYPLTDVSQLAYVKQKMPVTEIEDLNDIDSIQFTREEIRISMAGNHSVAIFLLSGENIFSDDFVDKMIIQRDNLPSGIVILSIDGTSSIKIHKK